MKTIRLFIVLFLFPLLVTVQHISTDYADQINAAFSGIDLSRVEYF